MSHIIKQLFVGVVLLFTAQAFASEVTVHFDTDKSNLKASEQAILDQAIPTLKTQKTQLIIVGHADRRGSRAYNIALGERRATSVKSYLVAHGVPVDNISISVSYGKESPVGPTLADDRRVTVEPVKSTDVKEIKVVYKKNRISLLGGIGPQLLDQREINPQHFIVDQQTNPVGGIGYQRLITSRISVGVFAISNLTFLLSVGYDF